MTKFSNTTLRSELSNKKGSHVTNLPFSGDVEQTINCMEILGNVALYEYQLRDYQREIVNGFETHNNINITSARQMGKTLTSTLYALTKVIQIDRLKVLYIIPNHISVRYTMETIRECGNGLYHRGTKQTVDFPNGSSIECISISQLLNDPHMLGTRFRGLSLQASWMIFDESLYGVTHEQLNTICATFEEYVYYSTFQAVRKSNMPFEHHCRYLSIGTTGCHKNVFPHAYQMHIPAKHYFSEERLQSYEDQLGPKVFNREFGDGTRMVYSI